MHAIYDGATKAKALETKVLGLAGTLRSWDLDWDTFPPIEEWLDENWKADYGREQAAEWLGQVMSLRSSDYWNVWGSRPHHMQRHVYATKCADAKKAFLGIMADLAGDEIQAA